MSDEREIQKQIILAAYHKVLDRAQTTRELEGDFGNQTLHNAAFNECSRALGFSRPGQLKHLFVRLMREIPEDEAVALRQKIAKTSRPEVPYVTLRVRDPNNRYSAVQRTAKFPLQELIEVFGRKDTRWAAIAVDLQLTMPELEKLYHMVPVRQAWRAANPNIVYAPARQVFADIRDPEQRAKAMVEEERVWRDLWRARYPEVEGPSDQAATTRPVPARTTLRSSLGNPLPRGRRRRYDPT